MSVRRFRGTVVKRGAGIAVRVPFDPDEAWGVKERHHVTGTVGGAKVRGALGADGEGWFLGLGAAWVRDNPLPEGAEVEVELMPEGPQAGEMAADIAGALEAEPEAKAFFEGLATFYRKGYVRWIEEAKRPATRAARIAETVRRLKAGEKGR